VLFLVFFAEKRTFFRHFFKSLCAVKGKSSAPRCAKICTGWSMRRYTQLLCAKMRKQSVRRKGKNWCAVQANSAFFSKKKTFFSKNIFFQKNIFLKKKIKK
jgi:hypothetical protein